MKFFTAKQNEEITAKLEAAESENEALRNELADAQANIAELTGLSEANAAHLSDLVTAQAKAKELEIKIGEFEAKVADYDIKVADLTAAAEVTAEKVSIKAAELLAAQGHPAPVALEGQGAAAPDPIKSLHGFAKVSAAFAKTK
jgi:predicted nuclease with TOPRIM domain